MANETCPTRLIDDAPADADAFGAHDRIADTIARLVEDPDGGKTIGLSGSWGAGKSTIVRMLEQRYQTNPSRTLWSLDAWAHEGDPLRRTFLERLIAALAAKGWLQAKDWTEDLEILSKRRKISVKRNAPQLTWAGVLLAASVLFVPIGTAVLANQLRLGLTLDPSRPFDRTALLGLVLVLAPLVTLVPALLWALLPRADTDVRTRLRDAVTVFAQRAETSARTETVDSPEPSSLEFERLFARVMSASLETGDRRLVIVIDNLDRVGTTQALAVWSTLQTFMQRRTAPEPWFSRVWCLLPFDAPAIRRLWQQNGASAAVAESFLDKTFQLRFDVPPPQLSNWKDYLTAALKAALPEHTEEDFFRVYRLFAVRRPQQWAAPTPRELKLFVNQVGSLHLQWQHQIPLEDLAYYVVLQRNDVNVAMELLKGTLPAPGEAGLVSPSMRDNLSGIVYGAPPNEAPELLLRQPILDALESGDVPRLSALTAASDRFWNVLETCVSQACQEWPTAEGGKLLHALAALDSLSEDPASRVPWRLRTLVRNLQEAAEDATTWDPMDARAVDGILVLARRGHWATHQHDDRGLARRLFRYFMQARLTGAAGFRTSDVVPFVDDYLRLTEGLGSAVPSQYLEVVPGEPPLFLETARVLVQRDADGRHWHHVAPTRAEGVRAVVIGKVSQEFGEAEAAAVKVMAAVGEVDWSAFVDAAANRLRGTDARPGDGYLLAALHALYARDDATALLKELVEQETAYAKLGQLSTMPDPGSSAALQAKLRPEPLAAGAWLYTIMRVDPSLRALQFGEWQTFMDGPITKALLDLRERLFRPEEGLIKDLARTALEMGDATPLFDVAEACPPAGQAMASVVFELAAAPPRVLPPALLLRWHTAFPSYSRREFVRERRARQDTLAGTVPEGPFDARLADIYAGVLDAGKEEPAAFVAMCKDGLEAAGESDWEQSLSGDMGLGLLAGALDRRHQAARLGDAAALPLRNRMARVDRQGLGELDAAWIASVLQALDSSQRDGVVDGFLSTLERAAPSVRAALMTIGTGVVIDTAPFDRRPAAVELLVQGLPHVNDEGVAAYATVLGQAAVAASLDAGRRLTITGLLAKQIDNAASDGRRDALKSIAAAVHAAGEPDAARVEAT